MLAHRQLRVATAHREQIKPSQPSGGYFGGLRAFFGLLSQSTFSTRTWVHSCCPHPLELPITADRGYTETSQSSEAIHCRDPKGSSPGPDPFWLGFIGEIHPCHERSSNFTDFVGRGEDRAWKSSRGASELILRPSHVTLECEAAKS